MHLGLSNSWKQITMFHGAFTHHITLLLYHLFKCLQIDLYLMNNLVHAIMIYGPFFIQIY